MDGMQKRSRHWCIACDMPGNVMASPVVENAASDKTLRESVRFDQADGPAFSAGKVSGAGRNPTGDQLVTVEQ